VSTARASEQGAAMEQGFTLIEMIVTLAIAGILMAIGTWAMRSYLIANRESGTAQEVRSALRAGAEQSLSEGRTYCVYFTSTTWTTYRSDCTVAANKVDGPHNVEDSSITLASIAFPAPLPPVVGQTTACPTANRCAYFYPRGTALAGSLRITRPGKSYTVNVEGLTGRVSLA
jgi:prepilin-type N-terminal cleavage/methylation domain-containing protein